jgi:peroxiredoxin
MPLPAVGSPAPDFTLPSTSGEDVTLSTLRGKKVLLAFFPLAFTNVCAAELCDFTLQIDRFQAEDVVILPISVDSIPTLREFKAKEYIWVELLSDFKREVSRAYGTLLEDRFYSNRAYILIDERGIVRWTYAEETTETRRGADELLAVIMGLG